MNFRILLGPILLSATLTASALSMAATITLSGTTGPTCTYSSISVDSAGNMTATCQTTTPTCSLSASTTSPAPGSNVTITLNNCPNYTGSQVTGLPNSSAQTATSVQFTAQTAGTQYTVGLPSGSGATPLNITVQSTATPPSGCSLNLPTPVNVGTTVSGTIACSSGNPTSYSWSSNGGAGTSTATQSGNSVSLTPTAAGTFTVTYSATNASGQSSGSQVSNSVTVNPVTVVAPVCSLSLTPSPATVGSSVSGTISCSGNPSSYSWSASGVAVNTSSGTTSAVSLTPNAAGTLSITYSAANSGGSSASQTASVTVNAATGNCPANTNPIFNLQNQFDRLDSMDSVLGAQTTFVGQFRYSRPNAIGIPIGLYTISYGSAGDSSVEKEVVLSKCPGTFDLAYAPGQSQFCRTTGYAASVYFDTAGADPYTCGLTPGQTYYINWRSRNGGSASYATRFY